MVTTPPESDISTSPTDTFHIHFHGLSSSTFSILHASYFTSRKPAVFNLSMVATQFFIEKSSATHNKKDAPFTQTYSLTTMELFTKKTLASDKHLMDNSIGVKNYQNDREALLPFMSVVPRVGDFKSQNGESKIDLSLGTFCIDKNLNFRMTTMAKTRRS